MSKIGVRVSIDVKAIEKARLINHENGKCYLNMTVFIDPNNPGQYGDHGMITQDITKEEKDGGTKAPILGNVKVFWKEDQQQAHNNGMQQMQQPPPQQAPPQADNFDDGSDIPFANQYKNIEYVF